MVACQTKAMNAIKTSHPAIFISRLLVDPDNICDPISTTIPIIAPPATIGAMNFVLLRVSSFIVMANQHEGIAG